MNKINTTIITQFKNEKTKQKLIEYGKGNIKKGIENLIEIKNLEYITINMNMDEFE